MKPTRGNNSPACHATLTTTRRAHAHDRRVGRRLRAGHGTPGAGV